MHNMQVLPKQNEYNPSPSIAHAKCIQSKCCPRKMYTLYCFLIKKYTIQVLPKQNVYIQLLPNENGHKQNVHIQLLPSQNEFSPSVAQEKCIHSVVTQSEWKQSKCCPSIIQYPNVAQAKGKILIEKVLELLCIFWISNKQEVSRCSYTNAQANLCPYSEYRLVAWGT